MINKAISRVRQIRFPDMASSAIKKQLLSSQGVKIKRRGSEPNFVLDRRLYSIPGEYNRYTYLFEVAMLLNSIDR